MLFNFLFGHKLSPQQENEKDADAQGQECQTQCGPGDDCGGSDALRRHKVGSYTGSPVLMSLPTFHCLEPPLPVALR